MHSCWSLEHDEGCEHWFVGSEPLSAFDEEACLVELSADGKRILVGGSFSLRIMAIVFSSGREAQVIVWDWTSKKLRTLTDVSSAITALALSPDGKLVVACGKKATARVERRHREGRRSARRSRQGHRVELLPRRRAIVTAGPPCIRVWNAEI